MALRLSEVQKRLNPRRITLQVDDATKEWLADKGYSEKFGARAVTRVVRDQVVTPIAGRMLDGSIKDGDTVDIKLKDGELLIDNHAPAPVSDEEANDLDVDLELDEPKHAVG